MINPLIHDFSITSKITERLLRICTLISISDLPQITNGKYLFTPRVLRTIFILINRIF